MDAPMIDMTGGSNAPLDLDILLGPPLTDFAAGSSAFYAGSSGFVHVSTTATDSVTGLPFDLAGAEATVSLAVVRTPPGETDFKDGDWLARTAAPLAGTYGRVDMSELELNAAPYSVWMQITVGGKVFLRKAPGLLSVR